MFLAINDSGTSTAISRWGPLWTNDTPNARIKRRTKKVNPESQRNNFNYQITHSLATHHCLDWPIASLAFLCRCDIEDDVPAGADQSDCYCPIDSPLNCSDSSADPLRRRIGFPSQTFDGAYN